MVQPNDWKWSFIWKLKLPPRVLHFLWVLLHNKLLTNVNRAARGFALDTSCSSCLASQEDMDHVFRQCIVAKRTWEDICCGVTSRPSYGTDWNSWLFENLKCNKLILGRLPGCLLFAVSLWFIWKWRCEKVFNTNFIAPTCPGKIILTYVDDWLVANLLPLPDTSKQPCLISWSPPPKDWVKINVDGSWIADGGSIAAGGLVRNESKAWLVGFALNKGTGNIEEAELWGVLEGLKLAWRLGFRQVIVESDSNCVVLLLSTDTPLHHPLFNIIQDCKSLMKKDWLCIIQHSYREGNRAADALAKLGHSLDLGLIVYDTPPLQILPTLEDDLKGLAFARMIPSG